MCLSCRFVFRLLLRHYCSVIKAIFIIGSRFIVCPVLRDFWWGAASESGLKHERSWGLIKEHVPWEIKNSGGMKGTFPSFWFLGSKNLVFKVSKMWVVFIEKSRKFAAFYKQTYMVFNLFSLRTKVKYNTKQCYLQLSLMFYLRFQLPLWISIFYETFYKTVHSILSGERGEGCVPSHPTPSAYRSDILNDQHHTKISLRANKCCFLPLQIYATKISHFGMIYKLSHCSLQS